MSVRLDRITENDLVVIARTNHDGLGADGARDRLLEEHQGAIRAAARRLCRSIGRAGLVDELAGEGLIAFNQAIDKFVPYSKLNPVTRRDETARLWTYAYRGVVGAMWDHLKKQRHGGIKGLDGRMKSAEVVLQAHDELMSRADGRKPTPEEIAAHLNWSLKDVEEALVLAGTTVTSLDYPSMSDEGERPTDQPDTEAPSPSTQAEWREQLQNLYQAIAHLRDPRYKGRYERQIKVFILHCFAEMEVGQIAKEQNIPRGTVSSDLSRIKAKLDALRKHPSDGLLARYHAGDVTSEEYEHVEAHLTELSPNEPYCQGCKYRSDRLKLIVLLHSRGLDVEQIVAQLNFTAEVVKNTVAALRWSQAHSEDEELNHGVPVRTRRG